ncbi:phosphoenolpyruvate synthase [Undibacterium macrobrachii]|uniref:Phosphoenolpyruvate synthase n=2 Tax=Undibacterium macrobrachii TaxID=1119058 RepID=A0ABQ2XEJ4_9BURK|nr:phosphoenolpyruvate synthase [Undibacterium macrobrachii]
MTPNQQSMNLSLIDCRQATPEQYPQLGGKGSQLARLLRYGLPTPVSFVIPAAYCRTLIPEHIWAQAITACEQYQDQPEQAELALSAVRQAITQLASLDQNDTQLRRTLADLLTAQNWQQQALAVRSSAIGEDGQQHSFAGIHHSELNVVGLAALERAILDVIASLWTPQACAYRDKIQFSHHDANMAVVIMPMLECHAAGVIFTCDPRDGREDRLLISSVFGLADELVAGKVNGEDIIVQHDWSHQDWHIVGRRCAHSNTLQMSEEPSSPQSTQSRTNSISNSPKNTVNQTSIILTDEQAITLAKLACETAKAMDYSQPYFDIEWVFDGQEFQLVQARTISARGLYTYPYLQQQATMWTNGNAKEILPFAIRICERDPMICAVNEMLTLAQQIVGIQVPAGIQRITQFDGHVYLNASVIQWEIFQHFNLQPDEVNFIFGGHQANIPIPKRHWSEYLKIAGNFLKALSRFPAYRRRGMQEAKTIQANSLLWRKQDLSNLSNAALLQEIRERSRYTYLQHRGLCLMQGASGTLMQLQKFLDKACPQDAKALIAALMSEGEMSVSAQQAFDLLSLAKIAAKDEVALDFLKGNLPSESDIQTCSETFQHAYTDFLDRYGHRGNYESYISRPSWREQSDTLHLAILNLAEVDIDALQKRQQEQIAWAWKTIKERCHFGQIGTIKFMQKQAKMECNQREFARSHFGLILERSRSLMLEVGRRLQGAGIILEVSDVFDLDYAEIDCALSDIEASKDRARAYQHRIADRQQQIAHWNTMPIRDVVLQTAQGIIASPSTNAFAHELAQELTQERAANEATQEWQGIAVSMASYRGKVCLIESPAQIAKLKQGDIAIALSTDPSWLPIFLKAGGMIVETGGYLSHSAIVARELGIPTIVNLPGITSQLQDGDEVMIDGPAGRLYRLTPSKINQ